MLFQPEPLVVLDALGDIGLNGSQLLRKVGALRLQTGKALLQARRIAAH